MEKVNSQFRSDELVVIRGQNYPKIAGRLRLAHESNESLNITTEIIQYDGKVAVIKSICNTAKGSFTGFGMASVERDVKLAPAILELAETRSVARSLRFAGYGVETGAEEMSHLEAQGHNGTSTNLTSSQVNYTNNAATGGYSSAPPPPPINKAPVTTSIVPPQPIPNVEGGDNTRLSAKQYKYLLFLSSTKGSKAQLDQHCVQTFGSKTEYLTKAQASKIIEELANNK